MTSFPDVKYVDLPAVFALSARYNEDKNPNKVRVALKCNFEANNSALFSFSVKVRLGAGPTLLKAIITLSDFKISIGIKPPPQTCPFPHSVPL